MVKEKIEVTPVRSENSEETKLLNSEITRLQKELSQVKLQLSQQVTLWDTK